MRGGVRFSGPGFDYPPHPPLLPTAPRLSFTPYRMPYHLELGSGGHSFGKDKAIVVNSRTGKHYSRAPISIQNAKAQLRVLEAAEKKK